MQTLNRTRLVDGVVRGDNGSQIADKMDRNTLLSSASMHVLGYVTAFYFGDSMIGYGGGNGYASFMGMLTMYFYDADLYINDGQYFNNATGEAFPDGPRGQNFGVGGTNIDHLLNIQMKHIRDSFAAGTLGQIGFLSTFQNNRYYSGESVEADCLKVIGACEEIIYKMGRNLVVYGPHPQNDLAASASSKHQIDAYMKNWAATCPGVVYISIIDALKSGDPAREANDFCDYLGYGIPNGTPGHASWPGDGIHHAPLGAFKTAEQAAPRMPVVVRATTMPAFPAQDYNKTKNPWGGLYGAMGRLAGRGGTIVNCAGTNPANWTRTASNDLPAGVELVYDQSKGITLTPTITGDPAEPLWLVPDGTPTGDFYGVLRWAKNVDVPNQQMHIRGHGRWINATGWAGVGVGNAGQGAPGMPSDAIISSFPGHGGVGGADYVMPFELNRRINFRSRVFYYGYGNRRMLMDLSFGFANGIKPTGKLAISRLNMFKTTIPA